MVNTTAKWEDELERWLEPFLDCLGHKARRRMCPLYVSGLIGPGDRKSVQPIAARLAPGDYDQLHHLIADGVWDAAPSESELLVHADDRLDGGKRHPCLEGRCVVPARSSAYALSCSRRFSPLSGRNSTYRPAQISGTGSDAALGNRDFFLNEPYSIGGSRCKSITMKE